MGRWKRIHQPISRQPCSKNQSVEVLEFPLLSSLLELAASAESEDSVLAAPLMPLMSEAVAAELSGAVLAAAAELVSELAAAEDSVVALEEAAAVLSSFFAQALARAMTPASRTNRVTGLILLISNMFTFSLNE
ncbi:hypothetical protein [Acidithiobacillus sp. AMEEHan]|uniref:hypothetical protein n=1 Tax=Acidithiobacillus sp. AMEEHan TaxID=2994951 RepID=UPI0027E4CFBF|nr:hypothetical protein [Acidithiobacillus sp. AMEEHan]